MDQYPWTRHPSFPRAEDTEGVSGWPTRTPLGIFDLEALGNRVRQASYQLAACREAFIHNFGSRGLVRR